MVETVVERLIEAIVSLAVALPVARLLLQRNRQDRWPAKHVASAIAVLAYAAFVGVCAVFLPNALRGIAGVSLIAIGIIFWRARSTYGRSRGLPPGSLAPVSGAMFTDQDFFLKQLAKHGPVFKASPGLFNPLVSVVGHRAALDFLKTHDRDLAAPPAAYNKHIPKGFLRYMDDSDHRDYHRLFQVATIRPLVATNRAAIEETLRTAFARWTVAGTLLEPAVTAMMYEIMVRLFFNIGIDDPRFDRLRDLGDQISFGDKDQYDRRRAEPALAEIERLVFDDTVRPAATAEAKSILDGVLQEDPKAVEDATVRRNLIYMLETGHRDVAGLLVWVVKLLSENRPWVDRLRSSLAARDRPTCDSLGTTLADRIIMESLRLERSEYLFRRALTDVRIGPFTIPKDWNIRICVREGHRTNAAFEHPNQFNPDRFLDRAYDRTDYAPFGLFHRRCIGQTIVADVGRLFLEELFGPYDIEVVGDGPVEFKAGHWHPSSTLRIRLITAP